RTVGYSRGQRGESTRLRQDDAVEAERLRVEGCLKNYPGQARQNLFQRASNKETGNVGRPKASHNAMDDGTKQIRLVGKPGIKGALGYASAACDQFDGGLAIALAKEKLG